MTLTYRFGIAGLGLAATLLVAVLWPTPNTVAHVLLATIILLVGCTIFLLHGKRQFTVTGLFSLAMALFMGYGSLIAIGEDRPGQGMYIALFSTALGFSGATLLMGAWKELHPGALETGHRFLVAAGTLMLPLLYLMQGTLNFLLIEGASFASVVLVGAGLILSPDWKASASPLLLLPYLIVYAEAFHGGSGRLRLVALLATLALMYSARFPRWRNKIVTLSALPLALLYFANERLRHRNSSGASRAALGESTGLESMLAAPRSLARLIEVQSTGAAPPLEWGSSFLTPIGQILPPGWTPEFIPRPFNYELVQFTNPELYGTYFNTVASYYGEWWWNFGVIGVVLGSLVLGPALNLLDSLFRTGLDRANQSAQHAVVVCVILCLVGGVSDLAWAGAHGWILRAIARLPLLVFIFFLVRRSARATASGLHARRAYGQGTGCTIVLTGTSSRR